MLHVADWQKWCDAMETKTGMGNAWEKEDNVTRVLSGYIRQLADGSKLAYAQVCVCVCVCVCVHDDRLQYTAYLSWIVM